MKSLNTIERLYQLEDSDCEIIQQYSGERIDIEIRQFENLRWLHINGVAIQSVVDIQNPVQILNPVNGFLLCGLIYPKEINQVLNLGLGGASIERYLIAEHPNTEVHSVESSELIIHIARDFFFLPYEYPVYHLTANDFIVSNDAFYDVIFCDMFENENHPECMYEEKFYKTLANRLNRNGAVVINVLTDNQEKLITLLKAIRMAFAHTGLVEIKNHNNAIVYAHHQHPGYDDKEIKELFDSYIHKHPIKPITFDWRFTTLPEVQ